MPLVAKVQRSAYNAELSKRQPTRPQNAMTNLRPGDGRKPAKHLMQVAKRGFCRATHFVEWHISHVLLGRPLWLQNRFNQRYQALCFADYKHLRNGNPEVAESLWMERNLRSGDVVLDVGANHGIVSLECSLFVGPTGTIHAFEPAPRTRACLIQHLMLNHIDNVAVFGVAV